MKFTSLIAAVVCGIFVAHGNARAQTNLQCVGHANDFAYGAFDVAVSGHYAFLANGGDGLRIYDVSNPKNPVCVGHTNDVGLNGNAMGIALFDDYAYVANGNDGMRIYDISDPTHPKNVGHAPEIANPASSFGIAASGVRRDGLFQTIRSWFFGKHRKGAHYAFLANYNDGLRIYDVSDPANPKRIAHVNDGGTALFPAVSGKYLFLANDFDGLRIYDISNPANPTNIARIKDTGYPWGVAISGKYAYVADNFYGLSIFDISDPTHPISVAHINNSPPREVFNGHNNDHVHFDGSAYGIAVAGHHAYLANFGDGVRVYDISVPTNPINIAHTATNFAGFARRIAVTEGYAYVANANDGLRIYKVWDDNPPSSRFSSQTAAIIVLVFISVIAALALWRFNVARKLKNPT